MWHDNTGKVPAKPFPEGSHLLTQKHIGTVEPVVGEVAFFDNGPRTAKVWATEDSMLLRLNFEDYQKFAAANPHRATELLLALGALVSRRFRDVMMRARV